MRIFGANNLAVDRERAFHLLQDPEVLARAMPGCDQLVKVGLDTYQIRMKLLIGSMSGLFDGTVQVADSNPPESLRLVVESSNRMGFVKGDGLLKLSPGEGFTQVAWEGEVQVGGTIAAVGQRLIESTARMLIKRFFEKLAQEAA